MVECTRAMVDVAGSSPVSRLPGRVLTLNRILRGSNSVVECNLAKVDVAGSSPVSRLSLDRWFQSLRE